MYKGCYFCRPNNLTQAPTLRLQRPREHILAQVVKLVDTPDLGSGAVRCVGSSPILGNSENILSEMVRCFFLLKLLLKNL